MTLSLADEPEEIVRRLVTECLVRVDVQANPQGGDVARLVERLRTEQESPAPFKTTLAGVMVLRRTVDGARIVDFRPAPPRRGAAGLERARQPVGRPARAEPAQTVEPRGPTPT